MSSDVQLGGETVVLGTPGVGLVCEQLEPSATPVHVSVSGSTSRCNRRAHDTVVFDDIICISTSSSDGESGDEVASGTRLQSSVDSTVVSHGQLVSGAEKMVSGRATAAAARIKHVVTTPLVIQPSTTRADETKAVAGPRTFAKKAGYSDKVLKHMELSRASTTRSVYNSKWQVFERYCKDQGWNPYLTRSADIAEFFTHLFEERNLSARTIQGYRSAIGAQLKLSQGLDLSQDEYLNQLMKSFFVQKPIKDKTIIQWDLNLVLYYLKYGNLQFTSQLTPRALTLKTVFLLALASGKRRGELHALENNVRLVNGSWDEIALRPHPSFLGKSHFVTSGAGTFKEIVIPALSSVPGSQYVDLALCPVHTLRAYLKLSETYRSPAQKRLIISFMKGRELDISAQSISNYLKWLVEQAYDNIAQTEQLCRKFKMTAHDVRGIASSLKANTKVTMRELMAAGTWATMDTFLKCYMKSFSQNQLTQLYEMGPLIASGSVFQA